jgi:hypothetical protein
MQSARAHHSISTLQQSTSNQRGIHLGHEWPPRNHAMRIADARMNPGFRPLGVRLSVACHVCVLSCNEELERTTPIWVPVGKSNRMCQRSMAGVTLAKGGWDQKKKKAFLGPHLSDKCACTIKCESPRGFRSRLVTAL